MPEYEAFPITNRFINKLVVDIAHQEYLRLLLHESKNENIIGNELQEKNSNLTFLDGLSSKHVFNQLYTVHC